MSRRSSTHIQRTNATRRKSINRPITFDAKEIHMSDGFAFKSKPKTKRKTSVLVKKLHIEPKRVKTSSNNPTNNKRLVKVPEYPDISNTNITLKNDNIAKELIHNNTVKILLTSELQAISKNFHDSFSFVTKNVNRLCRNLAKQLDTQGKNLLNEYNYQEDINKNKVITTIKNPINDELNISKSILIEWLNKAKKEIDDLNQLKHKWLHNNYKVDISKSLVASNLSTTNLNFLKQSSLDTLSLETIKKFQILSMKSDQLLHLLQQLDTKTDNYHVIQQQITDQINQNALAVFKKNDAKSIIKQLTKE